MNKTKKKIAALQSYLGRDQQGLALLKAISNSANETRKELASSIDDLDEKNRMLSSAINSRDAEFAEKAQIAEQLQSANSEIKRLSQANRRLHTRCDELQTLVDRYEEDVEPPVRDVRLERTINSGARNSERVIDVSEFTRMFNVMKKEIKFAPKPIKIKGRLTYELFDIIDDFSFCELAKLGRFVAVVALTQMYPDDRVPPVSTEFTLKENAAWGKVLSDKALAKFVHWFKNNIKINETEAAIMNLSCLPKR